MASDKAYNKIENRKYNNGKSFFVRKRKCSVKK